MSMSGHIEQLRRKHESLSAELEKAQRSPSADSLSLTALKKQKLQIKEELERLSS
jgi:hypothetical protein